MKKSLFVVLVSIAINSNIKSASIVMSKEDSLKTALVQKYNQTFINSDVRSGNFAAIYKKQVDASAWLKVLEDIEKYISSSVDVSGYYSNAIKSLKTTSQDLVNIINKGMPDKNNLKDLNSISSKLNKNLQEWEKLKSNFEISSSYSKSTISADNNEKKSYLELLIKAAQLLSKSAPDSLYAGFPGGLIYILQSSQGSAKQLDMKDLRKNVQPKARLVSVESANKFIKA